MSEQEDLLRLATIKAAIKSLGEEQDAIEARLVKSIQDKGRRSLTVQVEDGPRVRGTVVAGTRMVLHEDKLRQQLDAKQWEKVSTRVLDKEKLEAAVVQNIVDAQVVAAASEEFPNKPYIRVTGKVPQQQLGHVLFDGPMPKIVVAQSKRVRRPRAKVV